VEFLEFRGRLQPASGLQSAQFRELEFLSGLKDPAPLRMFPPGTPARERLDRRMQEESLTDAFDRCLSARGLEVVGDGEARRDGRLRALERIYRGATEHYDLYVLCEAMIEYDENFRLWRYHHLLMVERMIGHKPGTGGTEGVGYLEKTLAKRIFPELWQVRTRFDGAEG